MVQYTAIPLDASFAALSDPTRRGVLAQRARRAAEIAERRESQLSLMPFVLRVSFF